MKAIWMIGLVAAALFGSAAARAQIRPPEVAEKESGLQKSAFVDTGKAVMDVRWTHEKTVQDGKTLVRRTVEGTWYLAKAPIPWKEESLIELTQDGARTLSWKKDSYGDENESWSVVYDWAKRKVTATHTKRDSGKTKTKTLDLTPDVVTGEALELVLRGFPFEKGEGTKITARLLFEGDSFLSGHVLHRGETTVDTPLGKIPAYKLEMKPTGVMGGLAPTMYYYFAKAAPHVFLLHEGREAGPLQPRTRNVLVEMEPKPGAGE